VAVLHSLAIPIHYEKFWDLGRKTDRDIHQLWLGGRKHVAVSEETDFSLR